MVSKNKDWKIDCTIDFYFVTLLENVQSFKKAKLGNAWSDRVHQKVVGTELKDEVTVKNRKHSLDEDESEQFKKPSESLLQEEWKRSDSASTEPKYCVLFLFTNCSGWLLLLLRSFFSLLSFTHTLLSIDSGYSRLMAQLIIKWGLGKRDLRFLSTLYESLKGYQYPTWCILVSIKIIGQMTNFCLPRPEGSWHETNWPEA